MFGVRALLTVKSRVGSRDTLSVGLQPSAESQNGAL